MLRRVALVITDVSEELSASFIRLTGIGTEVSPLDDTSSCDLKFITLAYRLYILIAD
jgi:hypothetical protein